MTNIRYDHDIKILSENITWTICDHPHENMSSGHPMLTNLPSYDNEDMDFFLQKTVVREFCTRSSLVLFYRALRLA